jgi:hypothetical protein
MPADGAEQRGLRGGHLLALAGALAALGSLWAPWYRIDLSSLPQVVSQLADRLLRPDLAAQVKANVGSLPTSASVDAWDYFHHNDILIAALSGLVILLVISAAGALGDGISVVPRSAGRACAVFGGLSTLLVGAQFLLGHPTIRSNVPSLPTPPMPIDKQWGAYLCLAGSVAMFVGGLMAAASARSAPSTSETWTPPIPDHWEAPADGFASPVVDAHDDAARRGASVAPPAMVRSDTG